MAETSVTKIARPAQMRGFLISTIKRNFAIATVVTGFVTAGWYFTISKPRKEAYAAFYKQYNENPKFR
ncbi:hypothetical protein TCAL_10240 [Tigriopus californicus]|uniref:Uncharacterized protein n=1 Tax=Tigriopus californicus TaxID=6832 RepID=A0A553NUV4_TIGCA|nr:hypothetical protein TCAL_10240 [Tigriopus californicus]